VFDIVVELSAGSHHQWTVVKDVGAAVDCLLAGKPYKAEVRRRDPRTGGLTMELVYVE